MTLLSVFPDPLRVVSCMADNAEPFAHAVAQALGRAVGVPVEFVVDCAWPQREQMLYDGSVQVAWLCGLPYVRDADREDPRTELLAAPVMRPARYAAKPVYFTDVMVRSDHRARSMRRPSTPRCSRRKSVPGPA